MQYLWGWSSIREYLSRSSRRTPTRVFSSNHTMRPLSRPRASCVPTRATSSRCWASWTSRPDMEPHSGCWCSLPQLMHMLHNVTYCQWQSLHEQWRPTGRQVHITSLLVSTQLLCESVNAWWQSWRCSQISHTFFLSACEHEWTIHRWGVLCSLYVRCYANYLLVHIHYIISVDGSNWLTRWNESTSGADASVLCTVYYYTHIHELSRIPDQTL